MESVVIQKKETKLVPELRFSEFKGDWENRLLGDIANFYKGKGISKAETSETGKLECIRYGELYTKYGELIKKILSRTDLPEESLQLSEFNDVIIPASGESQIDIATASCVLKGGVALGGDLNIIRTKMNGVFLAYYLNNKRKTDIARLSQGISVIHLYSKQLKTLNLNLPKEKEQQKIASFLSAVDTKIQQLQRKKELLEQYKKGVMQQIFPSADSGNIPQIRFKKDDGSEYPDWVEKRLGDICEMTSSKRVYLSDYVEKGIPFYRGKEITELRNGQTPSDILYITEQRYFDFKNKFGVPTKNDILITAVGTLGNVLKIRNNDKFYFKDGNLIWLKHIKENPDFLEIFIQWNRNELIKTSIGSTQKALTMVELRKLKFNIPSRKEQQKITDFLSAIDDKIDKTTVQIERTQQFKKGLLQQMFV